MCQAYEGEDRGLGESMRHAGSVGLFVIMAILVSGAQQANTAGPSEKTPDNSSVIPAGAKVYIAPMPDDFNQYLKAAMEKKKVPVRSEERRVGKECRSRW